MADRKHIRSIEGQKRPADVFQPHLLSVELFEDMDEIFREARKISAGGPADADLKLTQGQRAVAIVTPGRLIMVDPAPEPNTIVEEKVAPMLELFAGDTSLNISVISYTFIEALTTEIDKAIPFRGFLNAWAYAGHNVIVFEGHPSAFDSGVRDADVLLMDSGMVPFVQFNWVDAARRVMGPGGRIFIHDRATYSLGIVTDTPQSQSQSKAEADYAEFLLRILWRGKQSYVEITSGEKVPDLLDFATQPTDRDFVMKFFDRDKLDAERLIKIILQRAGWSRYNPFKKTGTLSLPVPLVDGSVGKWKFVLTLTKNAAGKQQLRIER